ncbi:hypothetical protein PM082_016395 [Marasmius tenuissimus]|nr:hypothetical protein PM082_016395 [Marasmius tenuissimus]
MANAGLDGSVHWGQILTTRLTLSTGDRRNGDAVISETAVRICWEAPSKQGYTGYTTLDKAQHAVQIAEADYHSAYISANLHVGLPGKNANLRRPRTLPLLLHSPYRYQLAIHEASNLRASLWQRGMRSASILFFPYEPTVTVKLSAHDVKELGALKIELEKILEGEVICLERQPIWDDFFHRPEGQAYLRQLEIHYPPVTVVNSSRVRRLTLFGQRDRRELVSQELLQKYRGLNAGEQ